MPTHFFKETKDYLFNSAPRNPIEQARRILENVEKRFGGDLIKYLNLQHDKSKLEWCIIDLVRVFENSHYEKIKNAVLQQMLGMTWEERRSLSSLEPDDTESIQSLVLSCLEIIVYCRLRHFAALRAGSLHILQLSMETIVLDLKRVALVITGGPVYNTLKEALLKTLIVLNEQVDCSMYEDITSIPLIDTTTRYRTSDMLNKNFPEKVFTQDIFNQEAFKALAQRKERLFKIYSAFYNTPDNLKEVCQDIVKLTEQLLTSDTAAKVAQELCIPFTSFAYSNETIDQLLMGIREKFSRILNPPNPPTMRYLF